MMKLTKIKTLLILIPLSTMQVQAIIPVTDAAAIAGTAAGFAKQVTQWAIQFKNWKEQYESITDVRLDGSLLDKIAGVNDLLKEYNLEFSDLDLENPKSQIGVYAKSLVTAYNLFDDCGFSHMSTNQKQSCKNEMLRGLMELSAVKTISEQGSELITKLTDLNNQLKNAEDSKDTQDITAGIQSTVASLSALKMQYEMIELRNKASEKIDKRRAEQERMQRFENSANFYNKTIF